MRCLFASVLTRSVLGLVVLAASLVAAPAADPYRRVVAPGQTSLSFVLQDHLRTPTYRWPRTLLQYRVDFRAVQVRADQLVLQEVATGAAVPFQLSDVQSEGGYLQGAQVCFFSDLPSGATRHFALHWGSSAVAGSAACVPGVSLKRLERYVEVEAGSLQVRLPTTQTVTPGAVVPGPILGLARGGVWIGTSQLRTPGRQVRHVESTCVEQGPLFACFRVRYDCDGGAAYVARIKVIQGYEFLEFTEEMTGFQPEEQAAVEMRWDGFRPEYRFGGMWSGSRRAERTDWLGVEEPVVSAYVEEDPHWGPGWREDPAREMVFKLAPYAGNGVREIPPHLAFWNRGEGAQELGVFVLHAEQWQDHQYQVWQHTPRLQVRFRYNRTEGLVWTWPLVHGTRSTGISLHAPAAGEAEVERVRAEFQAKGKPIGQVRFDGATMQLRYNQLLRARYGYLSLDRVKDWVLTVPPDAVPPQNLLRPGAIASADEYERRLFADACTNYPLGANTWPGVNSIQHRSIYNWVVEGYLRWREAFRPEQKRRIEAMLLFCAYATCAEEMHPIRTALAGCPNMAADGWCVPMQMAFLFPGHPLAAEWRDYYELTMRLSSQLYTRPDVPVYESRGGRWTESLGTYHWAHLRPTGYSLLAGILADGKNRWASPEIAARGRWLVDMLTAPIYNPHPYWRQEFGAKRQPPAPLPAAWKPGEALDPAWGFQRQYPAHGAHGSGTTMEPQSTVRLMGQALRRYSPLVAEHLLWIATSPRPIEGRDAWTGVEQHVFTENNPGCPPDLRSCKYTGHGLVLRAGVNTPRELSLHLEQVDRGPNYRWGNAGENASGSLYFYAQGKVFTAHERESAGDRNLNDTDGVTTFGVMKDGEYRSIGMNLLERPLYDLGVAQFAEVVPRAGAGAYAWPEYQSRSILLVGTDYFLLDDQTNGAASRFSWFTALDQEFPHLVFLQPAQIRQDHWTELRTPTTKGFHRDLVGSHRVLVAPDDTVTVEGFKPLTLPFLTEQKIKDYKNGSRLPEGVYRIQAPRSRDLVFRSATVVRFDDGQDRFQGTVGVIRHRAGGELELAMVGDGCIGSGELTLRSDTPALGVSAVTTPQTPLAGRSVSRTPGELRLCFSGALAQALRSATCYVDATPAQAEWVGEELRLRLPAGEHRWELSRGKPTPTRPEIVRTEDRRGGGVVYWREARGAEAVCLEGSMDAGRTWRQLARVPAAAASAQLDGLVDGTKILLRAVAENDEHRSEPSAAYPLYVSAQAPLPPDGLVLTLAPNQVGAQWGEVLGVTQYRLYRRLLGTEAWQCLYTGRAREFVDRTARGVVPAFPLPGLAANAARSLEGITRYEYAVTASNGNGEGPQSAAVGTDPRSWLVWQPDTPSLGFRRRTAYWDFPYVPQENVPPASYPTSTAP